MNFDTIATLTLLAILTIILYTCKTRFKFHTALKVFYAALYRTKAGIKSINKIAKAIGGPLAWLSPAIIVLGFLGMGLVLFEIVKSTVLLLAGIQIPAVGLVLPIKAKGIFYVPFLYWIISIFIILVVHEGMHGVMARTFKLRLKSTGLVFLGALIPIIPGAFVEPDEKELRKAPAKKQLAVYAAGPVANILLALALLGLLTYVIAPVTATFYDTSGVVITGIMEGNPPAKEAGLSIGEKITAIDGKPIQKPDDFSSAFREKKPGDTLNLVTSNAVYAITLAENPETKKPWLGVYVESKMLNPTFWKNLLVRLENLLYWLYVINFGVGLFNLVPLGPIDGGRMLYTALEKLTQPKRAMTVWKAISVLIFLAIITNVIYAFF